MNRADDDPPGGAGGPPFDSRGWVPQARRPDDGNPPAGAPFGAHPSGHGPAGASFPGAHPAGAYPSGGPGGRRPRRGLPGWAIGVIAVGVAGVLVMNVALALLLVRRGEAPTGAGGGTSCTQAEKDVAAALLEDSLLAVRPEGTLTDGPAGHDCEDGLVYAWQPFVTDLPPDDLVDRYLGGLGVSGWSVEDRSAGAVEGRSLVCLARSRADGGYDVADLWLDEATTGSTLYTVQLVSGQVGPRWCASDESAA